MAAGEDAQVCSVGLGRGRHRSTPADSPRGSAFLTAERQPRSLIPVPLAAEETRQQ